MKTANLPAFRTLSPGVVGGGCESMVWCTVFAYRPQGASTLGLGVPWFEIHFAVRSFDGTWFFVVRFTERCWLSASCGQPAGFCHGSKDFRARFDFIRIFGTRGIRIRILSG